MNESTQLLLLKIIKFSGDISPLIQLGYEYSQIVNLINTEIDNGNAYYDNGTLTLTINGNELINRLSKNRKQGSDSWIEPEIQSKTTKFEKDFIYLPNMKELSF